MSGRARPDRHDAKSYLVTPGSGLPLKERCGSPRANAYKQDRDLLFIHHLQNERRERGEGIASFYARRSTYLAFFGRHSADGIDAATSFPASGIRQNGNSSLPRDTGEGRLNARPPGQRFGRARAESRRRDVADRPHGSPEPMEQDVEVQAKVK
jgi:hypothetical protein